MPQTCTSVGLFMAEISDVNKFHKVNINLLTTEHSAVAQRKTFRVKSNRCKIFLINFVCLFNGVQQATYEFTYKSICNLVNFLTIYE